MVPGMAGRGNGGRDPPRWEPSMQNRLPFKEWTRLTMLWPMSVDLAPSRKAAAVVLCLVGRAQRLAMSIPPKVLMHGWRINGVHADALTYPMHILIVRYVPIWGGDQAQGEDRGLSF